MITDSFDIGSEPIITPASFYGEREKICDIAIGTFSRKIYPAVLERFPNEQVGEIRSANRIIPVYLLNIGSKSAIFYLSELGSALAATQAIEINALTGADKFILFGSAGSLDSEKTTGRYVIPTEAYRDEGMSYHYAPPADHITIKNAETVEKICIENGYPYVKGRVWTTDAIFRETSYLVNKRKDEGCIAVEMELAGVQAVCDFYGFELYYFLVTGDVLDADNYTSVGLHDANHGMDKFDIALKIADML